MRKAIVYAVAASLCIGFGATQATAADQSDPAMIFIGKYILGDVEQAKKLVLEPVSQAADQSAIRGKEVLTSSEFFDAIAGCPILAIRNNAPSSVTYAIPSDLSVTWDCKGYALVARVKSIAYSVEVSQLQKRPFVPPILPPAKGGRQ